MGAFRKVVDAWECWSLLSPVLALCVNVVSQVVLVRVRRGRGFLRSVIEGLFAGCVALIAFEVFLIWWSGVSLEPLVISGLVNAPTYLALSYCYFGVANLGHTSIRIRLYSEIAQRSNGMSLQEIEEIYNEKAFAEMRLKRSLESGDIVQRDSRHYLGKARLAIAARIIGTIRRLLVGTKSEVE
jgi:hypothetical protein